MPDINGPAAPWRGSYRAAGFAGKQPSYTAKPPQTQSAADPFLGLRIANWRPAVRPGGRRGDCTIVLTSIGLEIRNVGIMIGPNGPWAAMPSEMLRDRDGKPLPDPNRPGKARYVSHLKWLSRDQQDLWSRAVIAALEREFGPAVLEDARQ
jgi:hypothetical protein